MLLLVYPLLGNVMGAAKVKTMRTWPAVVMLAGSLGMPLCAEAATTDALGPMSFESRSAFNSFFDEAVKEIQNFDGAGFVAGSPIPNPIDSDGTTVSVTNGTVGVTNFFMSSTGLNGIGALALDPRDQFFAHDQKVTFNFAVKVASFAIDINTFVGSPGGSLEGVTGAFLATLDTGETFLSSFNPFGKGLNSVGQEIDVPTGQFLGFTASQPFTSLTISGISTDIDDTFTLDTLVKVDFVEPPPSPVPGPLSLPLLVTALGSLTMLRRAKRA